MTGPPIDPQDLFGAQDTVAANIPENLTQPLSEADIAALYKATGREVPPPGSTVEPAITAQDLFTTPDATTGELALEGAKGLGDVARGLAAFPLAIVAPPAAKELLGIPRTIEEIKKDRAFVLGLPATGNEEARVMKLVELHHELASAEARATQLAALKKAEQLRGRPIGGVPTEGVHATLRRIFGVPEVSGIAAEPRTVPEALLSGLLGLPNHIIAAVENAPSSQQQARAIASGVGTVGLFATGLVKEPSVAPDLLTGVKQQVRADVIAQQRALNFRARGNTEPNLTPVRDVEFVNKTESAADEAARVADEQALRDAFQQRTEATGLAPTEQFTELRKSLGLPEGPVESILMEGGPPPKHVGTEIAGEPGKIFRGDPSISLKDAELAAIKERLLNEEQDGLAAAILEAHRSQGSMGTTIIPGLSDILSYKTIQRIEAAEPDISIDYFNRPDGKIDVVVIGKNSPLAISAEASKQFSEYGYFSGQEVSWNGKNYTIHDLAEMTPANKAVADVFGKQHEPLALLRAADGTEAGVGISELRRLPATSIDLPVAAISRTGPFTPLDAADLLISTGTQVMTSAEAKARLLRTAAHFDDLVAGITGQETKAISTVEPGQVKLAPGITAHPQYQHFGDISTAFDDPLPDYTEFVYSDPSGKPVGVMSVNTFTNGGFPGTYKQILAGVTKPVQGKLTTAIIGFAIDPRVPDVLMGRAAIALLEHADKLGVSRIFMPAVDEAGTALVARYINKYIGDKVTKTEMTYRVGEMEVNDNALYNSFRQYFDAALSSDKVIKRMGVDIAMTDADGVRRVNFTPLVHKFGLENGFTWEELPGLQRFLEQRLAKEARELYLTPEEHALYDRAVATMHPFEALQELPQTPLSVLASSNNMTAEWNPAGAIEVRARDDASTLLGRFNTEDGAREFINKSGQADGPDLDGGGTRNDIPPGAVGGGAVPPPPGMPSGLTSGVPPNLPPDPLKVDWLPMGDRVPTIADYYARTATVLAEYDRVLNAYDNSWGTQFSPHIRAVTEALRKMETDRHPWFIELQKADKLLGGGKRARDKAAVLSRYAETMSSADIARSGFFRPLNSTELNIGNLLASMNVDLARVTEFVRKVGDLEATLSGDALTAATVDLQRTMHLDRDHMAAATILRGVRDMSIDEAYSGHIIRYADAKMLEESGIDTSPEGFAKANNITPKELAAMKIIENIGDQLAKVFDIPEYRRIRGWIPHFVSYSERGINPATAFLGQRGLNAMKEIKFVSELARTGELTNYVNDPVLAMQRYINAGFRAKHLNPVIDNAVTAFRNELGKVPPDVQRAVESNLARYLNDARGVPEASRGMVARTVADLLKRMNIEVSGDASRAIVNSILATYSVKFIAFRAFQGMRDYTSMWGIGVTRFGWGRTAEMHRIGFGLSPEEIAAVQAKGGSPPGMSPIEIESPAALIQERATLRGQAAGVLTKSASKYADVIGKVSEAGLKLSLQPQVYARWHAGAYLEGRDLALSTLNDLAFGKITQEAAFKKLDLDAYSPAFTQEMQTLINAGKVEDAAHLYGQETGRMLGVTYGRTMHPKGWATLVGRIAGGYGRYPTWLINTLVEIGSRGSLSYRVRAWSRFWSVTALTYGSLKALGVDPWNWLILPGVRWFGGPALSLGKAALDLLSPSARVRSQATAEIERQLSPVPLAARDALAGLQLMDDKQPKPSNPVETLLKLSGARISEEPSALDALFGTR